MKILNFSDIETIDMIVNKFYIHTSKRIQFWFLQKKSHLFADGGGNGFMS